MSPSRLVFPILNENCEENFTRLFAGLQQKKWDDDDDPTADSTEFSH